ncbi:MAG: leucine-rich repeat domain-containing protein [Eubacteriales bacterium]
MPLTPAICVNCGASVTVDSDKEAAICQYCQTAFIVEKSINHYHVINQITTEATHIYGKTTGDFVVKAGKLTEYVGESPDVVVPDHISIIGENAFHNYTGLLSVTLPESIILIEAGAFRHCMSLKSINFPSKLRAVKEEAFLGCTALEIVHLPLSVESVEREAFFQCTNIQSLIVANPSTFLGARAFGKSRMVEVKVCSDLCQHKGGDKERPFCDAAIGDLYLTAGREVPTHAFINVPIGKVFMADTIKTVGIGTFYQCPWLTTVVLSKNLEYIGEGAFFSCGKLTAIEFPKSLSHIGKSAFCGGSSLTTLQLPEAVKTVHDKAFQDCSRLEEIHFSPSTAVIGFQTFLRCKNLKEINLPDTVQALHGEAFANCTEISSFTFPKALAWFDYSFLNGCTALERIILQKSSPQYIFQKKYAKRINIVMENKLKVHLEK